MKKYDILLIILLLIVIFGCLWMVYVSEKPEITPTPTAVIPTFTRIPPTHTPTATLKPTEVIQPTLAPTLKPTATVVIPTEKPPEPTATISRYYWNPCTGMWIYNAHHWIDPSSCGSERDE